jgi:hypothetical protein
MTEPIGTLSFVHEELFDGVGKVISIIKHTKSIEVEVVNFSLDDVRNIWGLIAKHNVRIQVIDLEDYTEYFCMVQGTKNVWYGDGCTYFTLKVERVGNIMDDDIEEDYDRPATSA